MKKLRAYFYLIILLFQFGTVLSFAHMQPNCGATLGDEMESNWAELQKIQSDYEKNVKPVPGKVLFISKRWAEALSRQLDQEGYQTTVIFKPARYDLLYFVPARWVVLIKKGTQQTWLGRIIDQGTRENEADVYFDFFGLGRNYSKAAADYDGKTHIGLSRAIYEQRFDSYVDGIVHDLHHALNHLQLKNKSNIGFYAEVAVTINRVVNTKEVINRYVLTNEYPFFFNFDEIFAFYLDYTETIKRLETLSPDSQEYHRLTERKEYYRKNTWDFMSKAIDITELAIVNLKKPNVREETKFLEDVYHQNFTAQIPIFDDHSFQQPYKVTVWLQQAKNKEKSPENFNLAEKALEDLLIRLKAYQEKLKTILPQ